jgi:benzylsuccinate CoA-transferase BbsF subunit
VIGQPQLADDPRFKTAAARKKNEAALDGIITAWTSTRDRWEATKALQNAGVAAFPPMSNKDLATDEHLRARGFMATIEHPEVGNRVHAGMPWTMSGGRTRVRGAAPLKGADTDAVLGELLGYTAGQIAALRRADVLS